MQRGLATILVVILIAVAAGIGGYFVYQKSQTSQKSSLPNQIACTQDAKLCPDGSSVGKSGPNCEFTPCPTPKESSPGQKIYQNRTYKYSLEYPVDVSLQNGVPSDDLENTASLEVGYHLGQPSFKLARVEVTDPEISDFKNPQHSTNYPTLMGFVNKIWQLNKEDKNPYTINKQIGNINEIKIDSHAAYQFTLNGAYISNWGEMTLDEEHLFTFTIKNNKIYILMYPTSNESLKQAIESFKFLP